MIMKQQQQFNFTKEKRKKRKLANLVWSLHMSTTYLSWLLKMRKKIAVCSVKPWDAKTSNPNGPIMPWNDAVCWLQRAWGSTPSGTMNSASFNLVKSNETSTSAYTWYITWINKLVQYYLLVKRMREDNSIVSCITCEAIIPKTSTTDPPFSCLLLLDAHILTTKTLNLFNWPLNQLLSIFTE